MTPPADPSRHRRKLRLALRRARERAGLTQREAAERLEWSQSKVIRLETGTVGISVSDLRALLTLYGVTGPAETAGLEEAARGSKGPTWWSPYHDVLSPRFAQYLGYESAAATLHTYHPIVVPGHLQTRAYATALLAPRGLEPQRLERVVELRMARQERMFAGGGGPAATFVLDESALRRRIGGSAVLAQQLRQLLDLADRDDVTVRVLPFEAGAHYSTLGSFVLLGFADDDDLLYVEHAAGSMTGGENLELLARYQECLGTIMELALGDAVSHDLISGAERAIGAR
ncbi:helix-turn-helix domain protein [Actinobacteria bacterium OK074]|nr:helix-turn-helix domain protein [Actinobacteria bacterium OK074]